MNAVDTRVGAELLAPTQGEKKLVLLPLSAGQELVRMPGRATEIAVRVDKLAHVDAIAERLRAALGPDYEVHTWKQLAPFADDVVSTQDAALSVITVIFLIVIMMGVANALLTSVLERVREIGTMVAVGARRRQILAMFVIEAALLGVAGAVVGGAAGSALIGAVAVNGVDLTTPGASVPQHLIPFIEPAFLARMLALSTIGAILAALWPAWRASRMKPVDALAGG
jgi:putative ABC transport system permease protein